MERTDSENDLLQYEQDQFLEEIAKSVKRSTKVSEGQVPPSGTAFLRQFMRGDSPVDFSGISRQIPIPATTGKIEPRKGSVFPSVISPVQGFRFQRSTVDGAEFPSRSSHLTQVPGTIHSPEQKRVQEMDEGQGGVPESENEFIKRLRAVGNHIEQTYPTNEDGYEQGTSSHYSPGDFRYVSPPQNQGSSGVAWERFRPGRESQSVIQNITVRESKRSKARLSDVAYQRRSSTSPAIPRVEIGLLPPS